MKTDQEKEMTNKDLPKVEKKEKQEEKYTAYQICNLLGINKHMRVMVLRKFANDRLTVKQWDKKIN